MATRRGKCSRANSTPLSRELKPYSHLVYQRTLFMSYRSFSNHHKDIKSFSGEYGAHWLNYAKVGEKRKIFRVAFCGPRKLENLSEETIRARYVSTVLNQKWFLLGERFLDISHCPYPIPTPTPTGKRVSNLVEFYCSISRTNNSSENGKSNPQILKSHDITGIERDSRNAWQYTTSVRSL